MMHKAEMVRANAQQLFVAEDAVDQALVEVSKLSQMLLESRRTTKMSAVVGQEAIDGLATLYQRLSQARGDVVDLHRTLDDIKTQIGARTVMIGSDNGKPTPGGTGQFEVIKGDAA
ncbi:hypothetical protein [Asticcacaulis sp. AC402]|uniref:hypothetical protein n=1 Tax=Asticcacaulis sp. AC402 TaxID=1282361 RepID=UPI0003C3E740|nr:hypothetical protein [Asticcacaulis sp. AC402]ESQ74256.1 hypothetical protein ABAC402_14920 [Asticcacaulis sp. AC402]